MTNVAPIRPTIGLSRIEQLRAFVSWEKEQNPDKVHIAEWALSELEKKQVPVEYNDAMQIINDPKAAAWELRGLAKSLLEELLTTQAREKALRDALLTIGTSEGEHSTAAHIAMKTLNRTTDDTALKQLLAAERERCAAKIDEYLLICSGAKQARALGDQP